MRTMTNIFRQAKDLLDKKDAGGELTWEESQLIAEAEIPLLAYGCPFPEDMPIGKCLEKLAKIVEEAD